MIPISERFRTALDYAATLHAEQTRKGTEIPYLSHLLGVASLAMEYGGTEDEAIAALLHDAVEDQGGEATRQEIEQRFGSNVAQIVKDCSDTDQIPKPPWRERKFAYVKGLRQHSDSTRLVSACDKLHNVRSILADYLRIGDAVFDQFSGGKDGTLWYYRWLVETFKELGPHSVAADLERVVCELEKLAANGRRSFTPLTEEQWKRVCGEVVKYQQTLKELGLDNEYPPNCDGEPDVA